MEHLINEINEKIDRLKAIQYDDEIYCNDVSDDIYDLTYEKYLIENGR